MKKCFLILGLLCRSCLPCFSADLLDSQEKLPVLFGRKDYMQSTLQSNRDEHNFQLLNKCLDQKTGNTDMVKYLLNEIEYLRNQNQILTGELLQLRK